jgi:hypothetical protein
VAEEEALPRQLAALLMWWTAPEGASRQWTVSALAQALAGPHSPKHKVCVSFFIMKKQFLGLVVAPLALTLAIDVSPAKAVLTYDIYESLGNLVVETSGSLNLTPTSPGLICGFNGALVSSIAGICTGTSVLSRSYVISGPSSFPGTALLLPASSVSGIATLIQGSANTFLIDPSYVFGTPIISNAIFNGVTLADIGLTPSSGLLGTWTLTGTSETIKVNAVPGPLPLVGVGAAFGFSRRLRQRIQRSQASANA